MLIKRWLTSIIAVPILIYVIGFSRHRELFYTLLLGASLVGLFEFYNIACSNFPRFVRWAGYLLTFFLFAAIYTQQSLVVPVIIAFSAFVPMTFFMLTQPVPSRQNTADIGMAALGPIYVGLPLVMLLHIDKHYPGKGNIWIFFLLVVVFANDTGAFYLGKLFGKHKLYEAMSPGKTWEGAIGGGFCSIVAAFWFLRIIPLHPLDLSILGLVLFISIVAPIGDLAESMMKRACGFKDSGRILPGHGGILDRIDGLLFSIPGLYLFLNWFA